MPFCHQTDKPPFNKEQHTKKQAKKRTNKEQREAQAVHRDYETEFTHEVQKTHTDHHLESANGVTSLLRNQSPSRC